MPKKSKPDISQINIRVRRITRDRLEAEAKADLRTLADEADVLMTEALDARDKLKSHK